MLRVTDLEGYIICLSYSSHWKCLLLSMFFPALTGQSPPGEVVRRLLSHLGGLSLINPIDASTEQHRRSKLISAPLVNSMIDQSEYLEGCHQSQQRLKSIANSEKQSQPKEFAKNLLTQLSRELQRCVRKRKEHPYG